jgi:hypothetical protein
MRAYGAGYHDLYFPDKLRTAQPDIYSKTDCMSVWRSGTMGQLAALSDTKIVWYGL